MSRPWMFGIVGYFLLTTLTSVGWGQAYLDLPEDVPQERSTSISEKFRSLTSRFRRDSSQASAPTSTSNSGRSRSQTNPRSNRSAARSRMQTRNSPQVTVGPTPRQTVRTAPLPTKPPTTRVASRPKTSDLLPDTKLFSRGSNSQSPAIQLTPKRLTNATSVPRAGSASSRISTPKVARKSPSTSRAAELNEALADLLKPQSPSPRTSVNADPIVPRAKKTTSKTPQSPLLTKSSGKKTFDLREALREDEEDEIAAAAAQAVADSKPVAAVKKPAEPQVVPTPKVAVEAPKPKPPVVDTPEIAAKPAAKKIETPVVQEAPKPVAQVASAPIAAESPVTKPLVIEPIVVAAPPRQAITIAEPQPTRLSPGISAPKVSSPQAVADPFEGVAKQVFSTPQQPSNPMRPFQQAVAQPVLPVKAAVLPERATLQTSQQPVIVSHVEGPRSILVGREATYQVTLENTSSTSASNLSAAISVPEWAELVDAMSTSGVVERRDQGSKAGTLEWKLSELKPRSSQALRLRLIPRSGRPLQIGVRWSQAPSQSQAVVEVQEPKLEIAISGPQEVRFGKSQRYRLTLRNPGTGLTEQVTLRLVPPGGTPENATTQKMGNLKPGEVRDIDLELTAREAGELLIRADAIADGGLKAETTKSVLCRKPELSVDWRGPDKKYAGTVAAYYFRVRNPGTTATEPVDLSVKLPVGAEFVSASEGYSINTTSGVISWKLGGINVDEEQFMQLRCKIDRAGKNDFVVSAKTNDGELSDSKDFYTDVVALADLKLEVTDPQGPLPLGESVVYEIRVRNRGTTNAENINVIGLFSEGIDPTTVEGAQFSVRDGRVTFHPIKSLPAGREVLLRIHAKANQVGTHVFRTEVACPKLDIKLAAEETTRFFEEEHRWEEGETPYSAERAAAMNR